MRSAPMPDDLYAVAFGNGQFVAVSPACGANQCGGTIVTSVDGVNWVLRPHGGTVWGFNAITYGNGQFVAVCGGGAIVSSTDGINWIERKSGTQHNLTGVAYGEGQFIAVSDGGQILTSSDG